MVWVSTPIVGFNPYCRECEYSCYRTSTPTRSKRISYYRCIGQDGWRQVGGKVCTGGAVRADELDTLVWDEVRRLLEDPRSGHAAPATHPGSAK